MANQIVVSAGAKVRNLDGVLTGTSGVVNSLPINASNGIPQLDVNGKILVSQLPNSVMEYQGVWNANTNNPTLTNGGAFNQGDVYLCNVAGTTNFGAGPISFIVGDQAIYSGTIWQKAGGATGTVTSVGITESGDSLNITGSPITTSGTINIGFNGTNLQYVNGAGNLTTFPTLITSIGLSMPSAFSVANSPLTANGTIAVTGAGTTAQYIRGDGSLATFPTIATEAQRLITEVYNETGATLTKGTVVYINGGHGNLPTITKALATGDATSAQTYGIVQTDITDMNNGYVVVIGSLGDLDTQAYANGTQLYLSSTTAGQWTDVKQYAPAHLVYVGIVVRSHPTQGVVEVRIQNGFEMDELHNVSAQSPLNNQGLFYNTSTSLWENKSIATALGYTPISLTSLSASSPLSYNNTTGAFSIQVANTSQNGYLSSTDWNTFNGKENNLTFYSPLVKSGSSVTIPPATSIANGYLTSTDWSTFNNKQATITLTTTGTSGAATLIGATLNIPQYIGGVTSVFGRTGAVVAAEGDYSLTQLSDVTITSPTSSQLLQYNGTSWVNWTPNYITGNQTITLSGDVSGSGTTAITTTIGALKVTNAMLAGSIDLTTKVTGLLPDGNISSASTWNAKQNAITLTTTGTSGAATFSANTLNIPNYGSALSGYLPLTGGTLTGALNGTSATFSGNVILNGSDSRFNGGDSVGRLILSNSNTTTYIGLYGATHPTTPYQMQFIANSTLAMTISSSGNLGLGVTPSAWISVYKAINIGSQGLIYSRTDTDDIAMGLNWYRNSGGSFLYNSNGYATIYAQNGGQHLWYSAPSGTAGNAITFTQAMTLDASGNLGINTPSPSARLDVTGVARVLMPDDPLTGAVTAKILSFSTSPFGLVFRGYATGANSIQVQRENNNSEVFPLLLQPSGGNVLIGTTTDTGHKLRVFGDGASFGNGGDFYQTINSGASGSYYLIVNGAIRQTIASTGAATFSSSVTAGGLVTINKQNEGLILTSGANADASYMSTRANNGTGWMIMGSQGTTAGYIQSGTGANESAITTVGAYALSLGTNQVERMRITSGGALLINTTNTTGANVLIGTSDDGGRLVSYSTTAATQIKAAGTAPAITFSNTVLSPTIGGVLGVATAANQFFTGTASSDMVLANQFTAGALIFGTSNVERMRIIAGGSLLVGTTSSTGLTTGSSVNVGISLGGGVISSQVNNNSNQYWSKATGYTSGDYTAHFVNGTYVGGISTNGSTTTYAVASDYRLKEDFKDYNGLDLVSKIKTYDYKYKSDKSRSYGVIAHELQSIISYAVTGVKDGKKMQGVDYSKIVPVLIKAIQELKLEIETLKNK